MITIPTIREISKMSQTITEFNKNNLRRTNTMLIMHMPGVMAHAEGIAEGIVVQTTMLRQLPTVPLKSNQKR